MTQNREREIRLQFLEEAQEYVHKIEVALLGLSTRSVDHQQMDAALRAAHSIKGGGAMMQFDALSQLAHRLEDTLKVLKIKPPAQGIDASLEGLLLEAVDCLRRAIAVSYRQLTMPAYVKDFALDAANEPGLDPLSQKVFDELHQQLGAPQNEDILLPPEAEQDMVALLFESEVEGCLQRLEAVIETPDQPCLLEELSILAQELGDLGEMLQLPAFSSLCASIHQQVTTHPGDLNDLAQAALAAWRRSQALVLVGQVESLPTQLLWGEQTEAHQSQPAIAEVASSSLPVESVADVSFPWPQNNSTSEEESQGPDIQEQTVRVPVKQLHQLNDLFGELTIERHALGLHLDRLRNFIRTLGQRVQTLERSNLELRAAYDQVTTQTAHPLLTLATVPETLRAWGDSEPGHDSSFDVLEMDRYSDLHALSQEVMETIVQIQEVTSDIELSLEEADRSTNDLHRTSKQLQTSLTQARMRPLSDLTGQFPRTLRDLSLQYHKPVELKIVGSGTLIDRTVLEALRDPLVHLLRNAFDHGLEDADRRRAVGKPETGSIEIRAAYRGNRTLITVTDDGQGIDIERIKARAQQHLGISSEQLASMSDDAVLSLIFEPGFSTAEQVTALSGRGVGLDVVRTNLRQVRGEIKVETQPGVGTTFVLSVPFTLSVMRVLLVESAGLLLALPTDAIEEMLQVKPEQMLTTAGSEVFNWESTMVPLVPLERCLEFHCPRRAAKLEATPMINAPTVLVVNHNNQWVGLQVERCWGEQEVAIRPVEGAIAMPSGFTGCTVLGDGQVVPLVDASALLGAIAPSTASSVKQFDSNSTRDFLGNHPPQHSNNILVVDDSTNVRRFLALTLEKAGYQVEQARDGQEAVDKLLGGLTVQAVISDIEMPRLDGFGLLSRVRAVSSLQSLPILMLTSRSGEKHRQLAMRLGATDYFTKPYKEQDLLETLQRLLPTHPSLTLA